MEQPSYYAVIPANVRYDKDLSDKAKLLYGEITALTQKTGFCWATNQYFADLYGVSDKTISRTICELVEKGYILATMKKIKVGEDKFVQARQICLGGIDKNVQGGMDKSDPPNNTSINNNTPYSPPGDKTTKESENENELSEEERLKYNFGILWEEYPKKEGKASAYRSYRSWLVGKKTPLGRRKLTNEQMLEAIENYKRHLKENKTDYQYIKQGSTFFNLGILDYLQQEGDTD